MPLTTKLTFDMCLKQLFPPLLRGGEVWMLPGGGHGRARRAAVGTCVHGPRSGSTACRRCGRPCSTQSSPVKPRRPGEGLAYLLFGGEPLSKDLVDTLSCPLLPHLQIWNIYGPTEATVNACAARITFWRRGDDRSSHSECADIYLEFLFGSRPDRRAG